MTTGTATFLLRFRSETLHLPLCAPHFYPDNSHVPFLGGLVGVIPPGSPAIEETYPQGNAP